MLLGNRACLSKSCANMKAEIKHKIAHDGTITTEIRRIRDSTTPTENNPANKP